MRRLLLAVAFLFAVPVCAKTRPVDWIFLVDTSKSMLEKQVFDDVKASLRTFVSEAQEGDSVALVTFDRDARIVSTVDIRGEQSRKDLFDIIERLQATGNRTHLGAAIAEGLDRAVNQQHTRAIVLFTDGKEDVRGIENPVSIQSNVQRALQSGASMFFVSMGEHEPELRNFRGAKFIEATHSEQLRRVAYEIRETIEEPPPPPPRVVKTPVPVAAPPPVEKRSPILKWLVLLALALGGAYAWYRAQKKRNRLEGEIEIVAPRNASGFVGLPALKATEVALSAIVPLDALAGADARLFVRRKGDDKKVWIAASSGSLRVNDIEVPTTELYDADTIQLGDAKLRFNRIGHERPQEDPA
ncbi:MAG TPA: VWA domain-containing protein [Thermoanaerobaculia bacterium]|nr:VWA domain-containing protein [Thermoanaerobaculia bacterium]